jgi:cytochrome c-type biogenesis protein CcsB
MSPLPGFLLLVATAAAYSLSAVLYLSHLFGNERRISERASHPLVFGFACHTLLLVLRTIEVGHAPMASMFETVQLYLWVLVGIFLLSAKLMFRDHSMGSFVVPFAALLSLLSLAMKMEPLPLPEVLRSRWFEVHVTLALLAYAAFTLSFSIAIVYLIQARQIRLKHVGRLFSQLPSLDVLDRMGFRSVAVGFPILTLGMITGGIWASKAWTPQSPGWHFDPKILGTVVIWLLYAGYLGARGIIGWRGRKAALLSVGAFGMVLFTFLIIGLFMTRIHAF